MHGLEFNEDTSVEWGNQKRGTPYSLLFITAGPITKLCKRDLLSIQKKLTVVYNCRTYYKAVRDALLLPYPPRSSRTPE